MNKKWCWFLEWNYAIAIGVIFERNAIAFVIGPALFGVEKVWK